jgi:hypothetical protein
MYDIKDVINKMKLIANIDSNANLARLLDISYNTLNTWLKRHKFPQEILIAFCKEYNCSLDYLLLNKDTKVNLFNQDNNTANYPKNADNFTYYGNISNIPELNTPTTLTLDKEKLHSNSYYLLFKENIYTVALCKFDIFNNTVSITIDSNTNILPLEIFNTINKGLIINYS